jgi:hypothetical protein
MEAILLWRISISVLTPASGLIKPAWKEISGLLPLVNWHNLLWFQRLYLVNLLFYGWRSKGK